MPSGNRQSRLFWYPPQKRTPQTDLCHFHKVASSAPNLGPFRRAPAVHQSFWPQQPSIDGKRVLAGCCECSRRSSSSFSVSSRFARSRRTGRRILLLHLVGPWSIGLTDSSKVAPATLRMMDSTTQKFFATVRRDIYTAQKQILLKGKCKPARTRLQ